MFTKKDFIIWFFNLKECKDKHYSTDEENQKLVYVFNDYNEYQAYFVKNGVKVSKEIIDLCVFRVIDNGVIIAFKGLCDHAIRRARICKSLPQSQIDYIHARNKLTFDEKVKEWEEYDICAPGGYEKGQSKRCEIFKDCHECLTEYAAAHDEYDKSLTDTFQLQKKMVKSK